MVDVVMVKNGEKKVISVKPVKINDYSFKVEKQEGMNVPVKIFANDALMEKMVKDRCIAQGVQVSTLPGIKGESIMMPDAHQGYGFSIGGVAAIDTKDGCISPGGIGFDINCGVRVLTTNLTKDQVKPKIKEVLEAMFALVPPGVGRKSKVQITDEELTEVLYNGAEWAVKNGYGVQADLDNCEEHGRMTEADPSMVSKRARSRGIGQLGTLGSGNHFMEVQYVGEIFDGETAKTFGITKKDQVVLMIHCGSRGLGHQVCSDYLRKMEDSFPEVMASIPEKDLIYAPAQSQLAKDYYKAMCAAANFAWVNRHIIGHQARLAFRQVFGAEVEMNTLYDVCHNMAKREMHNINGEECEVFVHRKGATRAFGPGQEDLPDRYKKTGQPILIPGSMGTSSYILVGTDNSMKESFGSTAHGAGRNMSRKEANRRWTGEQIKKELENEEIYVKAASWKGISEEAPRAYKNVDDVVEVSHKANIGNLVAQVKPMGVVKG
jgi:tRNA-splicing ligase RtcB (3'-phosphate/5'-hydroxy nucleic acid ligase)